MKLYRFSPIQSEAALMEAIAHIHFASHQLCKNTFGKYLQNAGNMGVFCHYDDEFVFLKEIRVQLTHSSDNPNQKYFELKNPITILAKDDVPETTYTHLYIRRPDPYRSQVGDIDFYLTQEEYKALKQSLQQGIKLRGARVFDRTDLDMIELHNPDVDVLAYVSTEMMSTNVRVKLSDATKL